MSIKFNPHTDNGVDYPNNIIMNKNAKKMYVSPSIKENVVELEQGIAAGSVDPGVGVDDPIEGPGGSGNGEGS